MRGRMERKTAEAELRAFLKERDRAFATDDISWASRMLPNASSPMVIELAFHKARAACSAATKEKRLASLVRLKEMGSEPLFGEVSQDVGKIQ